MSNKPSTSAKEPKGSAANAGEVTAAGAVATGASSVVSQRIALLGGTFDPPHNGHLALARGVCDALSLERLLLLPAGNPHFKLDQHVTPVQERVAMTELLAREDPRLQVSYLEAERGGVTYTADTLALLRGIYWENELLFIVGADCLEHIWRWRRAEEIAQLCTLVAVARPGYDFEGTLERLDSHGMGFKVQSVRLDTPDVSSTQLRELAAQGKDLTPFMPLSVARRIQKQELYRA